MEEGLNEILSCFKSSPDGLFLTFTKVLVLFTSNTSLNLMLLSGNSPFQLRPEKTEASILGLRSLLFTTRHIHLCTRVGSDRVLTTKVKGWCCRSDESTGQRALTLGAHARFPKPLRTP